MRAHPTQPALAFSASECRPEVTSPPFGRIVSDTAAYVFGLLHRLGVPSSDVPDVAQEVFLAVYERRATFEGRSSIKTWVCGICVHKAAGYRRAHARYRRRVEALAGEVEAVGNEPTRDPQLQLEAAQRCAALQRALDQLSDKERSVFVLYELEELPMADVARACGCPRFTAYTRLRAARKRLRTLIEAEHALGGEP